jgi:hypothetical protein
MVIDKQDKATWKEISARITNKVSRQDFNTLCELHAKYFNHKFNKPCTCSKKLIRNWIADLDRILLPKTRKSKATNK